MFENFIPGTRRRWLVPSVCALVLAGCGGGSGGGDALDASLAGGNAAEIRAEYADVVAKDFAAATAVASAGGSGSSGIRTTAVSSTGAPAGSSANPSASASPGNATATTAATDSLHPFAQAALAAVNLARSQARKCGDTDYPAVGPLSWHPRVAYAALLESEWMLTNNTFGHAWPGGELVWDRLTMAGYDWRLADENIAAGFHTLEEAMQAWIDSPPHCVALMRADIEQVGVSVIAGRADSRYLSYWTMALGTARTSSPR